MVDDTRICLPGEEEEEATNEPAGVRGRERTKLRGGPADVIISRVKIKPAQRPHSPLGDPPRKKEKIRQNIFLGIEFDRISPNKYEHDRFFFMLFNLRERQLISVPLLAPRPKTPYKFTAVVYASYSIQMKIRAEELRHTVTSAARNYGWISLRSLLEQNEINVLYLLCQTRRTR